MVVRAVLDVDCWSQFCHLMKYCLFRPHTHTITPKPPHTSHTTHHSYQALHVTHITPYTSLTHMYIGRHHRDWIHSPPGSLYCYVSALLSLPSSIYGRQLPWIQWWPGTPTAERERLPQGPCAVVREGTHNPLSGNGINLCNYYRSGKFLKLSKCVVGYHMNLCGM